MRKTPQTITIKWGKESLRDMILRLEKEGFKQEDMKAFSGVLEAAYEFWDAEIVRGANDQKVS